MFRKIIVAAGNEHARFMFNIHAPRSVARWLLGERNETEGLGELEEKLL